MRIYAKEVIMANKKSGGKGSRPRNSGMFVQGNTIGFDTRFKIGNAAASVWDESYPDDIIEYFSNPEARTEPIPTREGWAVTKGLSPATVAKWSEGDGHPRFINAWEICEGIQKALLSNGGLLGSLNPSIVKLLLSANHGVTERTAVDANIGNQGDKAFEVNIKVID